MQKTSEFSRRIANNLLVSCLFCFVLIFLNGCGGGSNPSALVGEWESDGMSEPMVLFKDGTGVVDERKITWRVGNGRLYMSTPDGDTRVADYKISGNTLSLDRGGDKITAKKKK